MTTTHGLQCLLFAKFPLSQLCSPVSAWLTEFDNSYVSAEEVEAQIKVDIKQFNKEEKERISQLTDATLDADGFVMAGGRKRIVWLLFYYTMLTCSPDNWFQPY